jgi:hypothetical protein
MMRSHGSLPGLARREGAGEGGPAARSDGAAADDHAEERVDLSIEMLEERLAPGGTPGPKRTAGWGC